MKSNCKKYNIDGCQSGEILIECSKDLFRSVSPQLVKHYISVIHNNQRQWSANTKGRQDSHHSKAKPHAQKGTGRARQGFLGAPQYKGGGRAHSPKPKFLQHERINRKERQAVIRFLWGEKFRANQVFILEDDLSCHFVRPRARLVREFLKKMGLLGKRIAYVFSSSLMKESIDLQNFRLSLRNFTGVSFGSFSSVNGYDLLFNQVFFMTAPEWKEFAQLFEVVESQVV